MGGVPAGFSLGEFPDVPRRACGGARTTFRIYAYGWGNGNTTKGVELDNAAIVAGTTATQTLTMGYSTVNAVNVGDAWTVGIEMDNTAVGGTTATQHANIYGSYIYATYLADGWATGIEMQNNASSGTATGRTASATQGLNLYNTNVSASSYYAGAEGITAFNDGYSRYYGHVANATQTLHLTNVDVAATALNFIADGVSVGNDGDSRYYGSTTVSQTLFILSMVLIS